MLAKQIALGFGIAVILPLIVYYGVSTIVPYPQWEDYHAGDLYVRRSTAPAAERDRINRQIAEKEKQYKEAVKAFRRSVFYVSIPVGIIAIIQGAANPATAIGTGLMFGGVFTLTSGYAVYWSFLDNFLRFTSLLCAFGILLFIGHRKLSE